MITVICAAILIKDGIEKFPGISAYLCLALDVIIIYKIATI